MRSLWLVTIVAALGCSSNRDHASDKAADDVVAKQKALDLELQNTAIRQQALQRATSAFDDRRTLRLIGLHAEQQMIAPQGEMISSLAAQLPLTDAAREDVDAKVETLRQQLDDANLKITDLEHATPEQWKPRDGAAGDAMKKLEAARDDAWKAFKHAKRTDRAS